MSQALIVIDIQNDFCPNGALAVPNGDHIVDQVNALMRQYNLCVLTQDWHPKGHSSFASSHSNKDTYDIIDMSYGPQILWPDHCVQNSEGASFHPRLDTTKAHLILRKGTNPDIDSYSAFFENDRKTPTGLNGYLQSLDIQSVAMVGLATDFCVNYSAVDAAHLGYNVTVFTQLCRAIDLDGSLDTALKNMTCAGVSLE